MDEGLDGMSTWRVINADVIDGLRRLPDGHAHCCVTSPPYWGLRDYGVDGQIGLEETPEAHIARLVEVFREVRRVLRDDGTVFVNYGDAYWGGGRGGNPEDSPHQKQRTNAGYLTVGAAPRHARGCGTSDKGLQDSSANGSACFDLCDGCSAALLIHTSGNRSQPSESERPCAGEALRRGASDSAPTTIAASPLSALASTTPRSSRQPLAACSHCVNCGACLSVLRSSSRDASLCVRRGSHLDTDGTFSRGTGFRTGDMASSYSALGSLGTLCQNIKPKDLIGLPWLLAFALRADGWYLRSDIIWHKPNPMPESVTDRPTKSHEYLFLLSKSARYYYDAGAIAEAADKGDAGSRFDTGKTAIHQLNRAQRGPRFGGNKYGNSDDPKHATKSGNVYVPRETRNRRTVWTVPTQPFPEAHFATFPEKLIEPCIKAGCPVGGTVLDPFGGSGTTAVVALKQGRSAVLCELNPEYVAMARRRIGEVSPLLAMEVA